VNIQYGFNVSSNLIGATTNVGFVGQIPSGTNNWNLYMNGTAKNYLAGNLGIGTTSVGGINGNVPIALNLTGNVNSYAIFQKGIVQSDVTLAAVGIVNTANTAASSFTLANYYHVFINQGTFGSGSTVTNQYGFWVDNNLIGATNNYGFYGNIPSGTNNWNLYMNGTAKNYISGSLLIGSTTDTGQKVQVTGTILATSLTDGFITMTSAQINRASANVEMQFTSTGNVRFFGNSATPITFTASTGAAVFSDAIGIGTGTLLGYSLNVGKNITGATTSYGINQAGTVQSDVTTQALGYQNQLNTQATSFTLGGYNHYIATQGTIGSGSVITEQNGFYVASTLTGATNNFGFRGMINGSGGRYNLFMDGTANNYLNGGLGIGTTSIGNFNGNLAVASNITGNINSRGIHQFGTTQSDVTTSASGYMNTLNTQATTFTLGEYRHFSASQGTIGSGSTITTQTGFHAASNLIGATNDWGFRGAIPSGTGRYNLYMDGTANNYLAGALSIGVTTANASALLQVDSTTQGVLFPRMTTTQKNAISSPATGLVVFDTTLGKLCVFSTTWQTITSS
jgi:hypothetical protein